MNTVLARSRFVRGYVPFAVRLWDGKYEDGKRVAPLRVALPFQTVETVNASAQQRQVRHPCRPSSPPSSLVLPCSVLVGPTLERSPRERRRSTPRKCRCAPTVGGDSDADIGKIGVGDSSYKRAMPAPTICGCTHF